MGSHVTVRDVHLVGQAQAQDDSVTTLEDTTLQIKVTDNDIDAAQAGVQPVLVATALHGNVVLNADGTFNYTPEANYFGPDSFTYLLRNGTQDSNVATVNITVTAVNDAPRCAGYRRAAATLLEDGNLTLDLTKLARDVEGLSSLSQDCHWPAAW